MTKRLNLQFHPLTADRWSDLESLFGQRGACGGCWCMAWRLPRKQWEANKGDGNRRAFRKIVRAGGEPGVLAYSGDEPIGWCAIAPRQIYITLERSRVLKPIDNRPVWSISCLFIAKQWRRRGVSSRLIAAAAKFATKRGGKIVEAYPVEPYSDHMPDVFAWTGIVAAYEQAGFKEVARRSRSRPVMRKVTRTTSTMS